MPIIPSCDGVPIHYDIHGSGPINLIFLHGWGGDGGTWSEAVKNLEGADYRTICLDLRGHGKSGISARGYTIQHFSEDVLAVADHSGAQTFVPVGFSMGGKLACYLAAKYPARVGSLVLIAPIAPGKAPVDRESALQAIRQARDWRQYETVFKNWFAPAASSETVKSCCQTIVGTPLPVLEATAELFLWTSLANDIDRLEQLILLVVGEQDPVYGIAYQEKETLPFLHRFTTATVNCGHFIPLERPRELVEQILQMPGLRTCNS